jgi:hypothetical protein
MIVLATFVVYPFFIKGPRAGNPVDARPQSTHAQ